MTRTGRFHIRGKKQRRAAGIRNLPIKGEEKQTGDDAGRLKATQQADERQQRLAERQFHGDSFPHGTLASFEQALTPQAQLSTVIRRIPLQNRTTELFDFSLVRVHSIGQKETFYFPAPGINRQTAVNQRISPKKNRHFADFSTCRHRFLYIFDRYIV
ncbi:MAG TPA: hypothetical protein H9828_01005 [Candidatus Alistipes intestinigallinarum]|uniref:Uncharacterized protein n=1 Tax=Candidatus Alistipes intestinigallinarum TaxID=2838440 RepID=A0A9D1Z1N5_9BACT|nr:hypothetical protein [Candidatus Alistipes intestinigallinarum]